jgi:hypothetical protein
MSKLPAQGVAEVTQDFTWGEVIDAYSMDIDDHHCTVISYHPWKSRNSVVQVGAPDKTRVLFHNTETSWSDQTMQASLIRWMAAKNLGLNQHMLVDGICRALNVPGF